MNEFEIRRLIPLVKWRAFRFSDNLNQHAAMQLVEDLARGNPELMSVELLDELRRSILGLTNGNSIDISSDLVGRLLATNIKTYTSKQILNQKHLSQSRQNRSPKKIICVLGAPRSGTSHLINLLAYFSSWATFTDNTHHIWPLSSLESSRSRFLRSQPQDVLQENSRDLKFDLRVSLPAEGENVLHRAFPTYRWVKGHTLDFFAPISTMPSIFQCSVLEHLKSFGTDTFVFKTTLSPLRVSHMLQSFPEVEWHFVHMFRHPEEVAISMQENAFYFQSNGRQMGHVEAWKFMVSNILTEIPEPSLHISYEQLWRDPASVVSLIFEAVNEPLRSSNALSELSGASFMTSRRTQPKPIALDEVRGILH